MSRFGSGQTGGRLEDRRLLTGRGRFVADLRPDRVAHAVILRSPHAHASIVTIDRAEAAAMPGVLAVLSGADVLADGLGPIPCVSRPRTADGRLQAIVEPAYHALAVERVRYVGDAVAVVVAEPVGQADAAGGAIEYQTLPAVADLAAAAWMVRRSSGRKRRAIDPSASAIPPPSRRRCSPAPITRLDLRISRVSANPVEARVHW